MVCGYELRYVEVGDPVDPEDHRKLCSALKCVLLNVARWGEGVVDFLKWLE